MYKPLSDSTLMSMTKAEIIKQLRTAEHNYEAMKDTVNQQAENFINLLANERKHGHWDTNFSFEKYKHSECSLCGYATFNDSSYWNYCPNCGAIMDGEI